MAHRVLRPLVHEERAHQLHRIGQRQPLRHQTHQLGQLLQRKEDAAEKHHGREKQGEVVGEKVVALGQRVNDERNAAEADAHAQQHRPGQEQLGRVADAQGQHHAQNSGHGEERLEGGPQHFGKHHVVQIDRRVHDAVPGFLHVHARERRVQRLKGGRVHGAHADGAAGQKQDVGHLHIARRTGQADLPHQRAHAVAKGHQPHQGFGNIAHQAGDGQLAPDQQVAQKNRPKAPGQFWGAPDAGRAEVGWGG